MKKYIFIIFVILFLFLNFFLVFKRFFNNQSPFFNDFPSYYIGSYLFWHHQNPYDLYGVFDRTVKAMNLKFLYGVGYSYPPLIAFLFYPLLSFTTYQAARIFALFSMVVYLGFSYLIIKKNQKLPIIRLLLLAIYLATFIPAVTSANHGQVNILVLVCLYFYINNSVNYKLSSFFLALAGLIKVYPVFFLFKEFIEKKWKVIGYFLFWTVLIFLLLGSIRGFNILGNYYFKLLPSMNNSLDAYYTNQSINGFISRILYLGHNSYLLSQKYYQILILTINVFILGTLSYFTLKNKKTNQNLIMIWLGTATLLAGKNSYSNFAPTVLIGIYLIENYQSLNKINKILFFISVLISNFLWQYVWQFNQTYQLINTFPSKFIYVLITSLGFLSLVIQLINLFNLSKNHE